MMANCAEIKSYAVKVKEIDRGITESILKETFSKYGAIFSVKIMPHKSDNLKTIGYVNYKDQQDAEIAAVKMNERRLNGCLLKTSFKVAESSARIDFRVYTDCKYMLSEQGCIPKDGMPCPYRHRISQTKKICDNWSNKSCRNKACPDLHPQVVSPPPVVVKTTSNPINSQLEEICKCGICLDRLAVPKMLACQHNFCKECLEEMVKFVGEPSKAVITCPLCNQQHKLLGVQTVKDLSESLNMKQMLDLLNTNDSDEPEEQNVCSTGDCKKQITAYCVKCSIFFCNYCKEMHRSSVDCNEFYSVKYSRNKEGIAPYCVEHDCFENYGCHDFGVDCGIVPVCVFCAEHHHKGHNIISINQLTHKFEEPLKEHIISIDEDKEVHLAVTSKVKTALATSRSEEKIMKENITQWKSVMLSKFLCMLNETEQQISTNFRLTKSKVAAEFGVINAQSRRALKQYEDAKEEANSLFKKSNIEVIFQARNVANIISTVRRENKPPDDLMYPQFAVSVNDRTDSVEDIFHFIGSSFGEVILSRFEGNEINEVIYGKESIKMDSLDMNVLDDVNPKDFIYNSLVDMKMLPQSVVDTIHNTEQKKSKTQGKKKKEKEAVNAANNKAENTVVNEERASFDEETCYYQENDEIIEQGNEKASIGKETDGIEKKKKKKKKKTSLIEEDNSPIITDLINFDPYYTAPIEGDDGWPGEDGESVESEDEADSDNDDANSVKSTDSANSGQQSNRGRSQRRSRGRGGRGRGGNQNTSFAGINQNQFNRGRGGQVGSGNTRGNFRGGTRGRGDPTRGRGGPIRGRGGGSHGNQNRQQNYLLNQPSGYTTLNLSNFGGAYQRPSGATSVPNLFEKPVFMCYRCGRAGHTVQKCTQKTTKDGRVLP